MQKKEKKKTLLTQNRGLSLQTSCRLQVLQGQLKGHDQFILPQGDLFGTSCDLDLFC